MRTAKISLLLVLMFALAMAAGAVTDRLAWGRRPPAMEQPQRVGVVGGSSLAEELQLTREQTEQIRPIWEEARDAAHACANEAERIQRDHEEQLKGMLTDEQKARYERLSQENHLKIAAQDARRKDAFRQAVARTEKLLREDQRRPTGRSSRTRWGPSRARGRRLRRWIDPHPGEHESSRGDRLGLHWVRRGNGAAGVLLADPPAGSLVS